MSRLKDLANKNHEKFKKIGLIDPDNSTVINDSQSTAINIYLIISNITFTISAMVIMIKYQDMFISSMIIVGVCTSSMAYKIMANAVQQHDMMINMASKLRSEYYTEQNKILEAKIQDQNGFSSNKIKYSEERLKKIKEDIHKAALEKIEIQNEKSQVKEK